MTCFTICHECGHVAANKIDYECEVCGSHKVEHDRENRRFAVEDEFSLASDEDADFLYPDHYQIH